MQRESVKVVGEASGSFVSADVDKNGGLVEIVFNGNIQSLALDYAYSEVQTRAVVLDARAITESLRSVYSAGALADELLSGHGH